jgi:hypothetical protein
MLLTLKNKKLFEDAGDAGAGGAKGGEIDDLVANMLKYAAEVGNLMKYMALKGKLEKSDVDAIVGSDLFKLKSNIQKSELLAKWDEKWAATVTKKVEKLEGDAITKAREGYDKKRIAQREAIGEKLDVQIEQGVLKFTQKREKIKQDMSKLDKLEMKTEHILDQKRLYDNKLAIEMIQYKFDKNKELNALKAKHKPDAKGAIAKTEAKQENETKELIKKKEENIAEVEAEISKREKENDEKMAELEKSDPKKAETLKKIKVYNKSLVDANGDAKKLKDSNDKLKEYNNAVDAASDEQKEAATKALEDYKLVHDELEKKYNDSFGSVKTNALNSEDIAAIIDGEDKQKEYIDKQKSEIKELKDILNGKENKKPKKEKNEKPKESKPPEDTNNTSNESVKYLNYMSIINEKLKNIDK